jgi:copper homeostasis protein
VAKRILLEISVETLERAIAAERAGADRIELCRDLAVGGLTPSRELMQEVRAGVSIPVFAMIRPREGDFAYSNAELTEMRESIELARELRMEGVVLGVLTKNRQLDVASTRQLVELSKGLDVTFHMAIDETDDLLEAVDSVIETGASRILTSGGGSSAFEGVERIAEMVARARARVGILPGAGITSGNVAEIVRRTGVGEVHAGLSSVVDRQAPAEQFEKEVRRLAAVVAFNAGSQDQV